MADAGSDHGGGGRGGGGGGGDNGGILQGAPLNQAAALFKIPLSDLEAEMQDALRPPGSFEEATNLVRATCVHGLAYSSAMVVSKTITAPAERVRLLLQTQPASYIARSDRLQGLYHASLRIPRIQGYGSLWRGNLGKYNPRILGV